MFSKFFVGFALVALLASSAQANLAEYSVTTSIKVNETTVEKELFDREYDSSDTIKKVRRDVVEVLFPSILGRPLENYYIGRVKVLFGNNELPDESLISESTQRSQHLKAEVGYDMFISYLTLRSEELFPDAVVKFDSTHTGGNKRLFEFIRQADNVDVIYLNKIKTNDPSANKEERDQKITAIGIKLKNEIANKDAGISDPFEKLLQAMKSNFSTIIDPITAQDYLNEIEFGGFRVDQKDKARETFKEALQVLPVETLIDLLKEDPRGYLVEDMQPYFSNEQARDFNVAILQMKNDELVRRHIEAINSACRAGNSFDLISKLIGALSPHLVDVDVRVRIFEHFMSLDFSKYKWDIPSDIVATMKNYTQKVAQGLASSAGKINNKINNIDERSRPNPDAPSRNIVEEIKNKLMTLSQVFNDQKGT